MVEEKAIREKSEMRKFLRNYHTHTALCNHAKGEIRDYVEAAVERGLKTIGFSCHAPYPFELKDYSSWYRMTTEQHDKYATEILALKAEYKERGYSTIAFTDHEYIVILHCGTSFSVN